MFGVFGGPSVPSTSPAAVVQSINETVLKASETTLLPSTSRELLSLPLRALHHAETFAFNTVPRHIARLAGIENVSLNLWPTAAPLTGDSGLAQEAMSASEVAAHMAQAAAEGEGWYAMEFMETIRKVGGFFAYITSVWSFVCLIEAIILNRITIYASTRRHLQLGWERRLSLRIIPIVLLSMQILSTLRALRCQTSPDYTRIRYGTSVEPSTYDYANGGGFIYSLASSLLPWGSDEQACSARKMDRETTPLSIPHGSFSLLWPTFIVLCASHFFETLVCALQGRPVGAETGMSIFEHSLAFAEAESMISQTLGLGIFGLPKKSPLQPFFTGENSISLTRTQILDRMNVTPELLLLILVSCCNSLTSHLLDVFGKQSRYRLLNTTLWGTCFLAVMCQGLQIGPPTSIDSGLSRFPTVCVVGFIPHLLVFIGIIACAIIYGLAVTITAFSLPAENGSAPSLRQRFALAHDNMQISNQIHSVRFNRHEDFYTTLLRIGYVALTAASEAVFLNEGKAVIARQMTWLEQDRLNEIEASRQHSSPYGDWPNQAEGGPSFDARGFTGFDLPDNRSTWESGYNKEKKIEKPKNGSRAMRSQAHLEGIGAVRSSVRFWHGISFCRAIFKLISQWFAYGFSRVLDGLGIRARPQWLKKLVQARQNRTISKPSPPGSLDFWILTDDGELELPENFDFDVELEIRKRERTDRGYSEPPDETRLDDKLYAWWRVGGSWGNQDYTPDYNPPVDNEDITSVVSMSTNASESDWEDYPSDGRRTPTQSNPNPTFSRETTPSQDPVIDMSTLARLLDPRDRESKEEARILAAHLTPGQGDRIMTRSQYRKQVERERSRVLLSSRLHQPATNNSASGKHRMNAEEEAEMLEQLIISRRSETAPTSDTHGWESGATPLGPNGPPCVVCQTEHRSIITWPCRCLCICEDCRVSLAMNNFGSCVTCRQEVGGFMRLWVP
ncbi:hypothetical protein N7528_000947 [Penicillium herquei]|nr:hypothetical protein N7528_000947 [Penicillium herquei]